MMPRIGLLCLLLLALGCGAPPAAEAPPSPSAASPGSAFAGYPPDQGPPAPPLATGIPVAEDESEHQVPGGQDDAHLISYLDPGRDEIHRPAEVLGLLGLRSGQVVADVGAGSGFWTTHLARAVAPDGKVLALDQDPHAVWFLRRRLLGDPDLARLPVEVRRVAGEDAALPPGSVDMVFLCDMHVFLARDPWVEGWLRGLGKALKPGGRLVVIEAKRLPHGAPLSQAQMVESFSRAGFELLREHDLLPLSYFMEFRHL